MRGRAILVLMMALAAGAAAPCAAQEALREYPVPPGSWLHDVAPAPDGRVWFTAQWRGALGWLEPGSGVAHFMTLGNGSRPHGVIVGPDRNAWVTDGGLNAIVRVDARSLAVTVFQLPDTARRADVHTAVFDKAGTLWFTAERGFYGRLSPGSDRVDVFEAPEGSGPYGMAVNADGFVYYVSLTADYLGRVDTTTGKVTVIKPPGGRQGTRRVWADSKGVLWITGWDSGNLLRFDPADQSWQQIRLPGERPQPYAVYVDENDRVWVSDFAANAILRYDPAAGQFARFAIPTRGAAVRQLLGRRGEVWGAESGADKLLVVRF